MKTIKKRKQTPQYVIRGRAIILRRGSVLMCRRKGARYWYLPGGKAKEGERVDKALTREIREELGVRCVILHSVGTSEHQYYDKRRRQEIHEMVFVDHCRVVPRLPNEVISQEKDLTFRWINLAHNRRARVLPASMRRRILDWQTHGHLFCEFPRICFGGIVKPK